MYRVDPPDEGIGILRQRAEITEQERKTCKDGKDRKIYPEPLFHESGICRIAEADHQGKGEDGCIGGYRKGENEQGDEYPYQKDYPAGQPFPVQDEDESDIDQGRSGLALRYDYQHRDEDYSRD